MEKKLLNIVKESPVLSRQELEDYVNNPDLSETQKYQIELKITNNPINQELLDAYLSNPSVLKTKSCCRNRFNNDMLKWVLGTFSLILIIGIIFFLSTMKSGKTIAEAEVLSQDTTIEQEPDLDEPIEESQEPMISETNSIRISPKQTIAYSTVAPITPKTIKKIELEAIQSPKPKIDKKYPAMYLADFKVTDYRKIRKIGKPKDLSLSGTPASEAFLNSESETFKLENDSTFYLDFLRETLRGFKHEKYQAILPAWNTIIKQFPEDDNALFYRALTYFKLEQFDASTEDLHAVLANPMSNFDEEANWYLALNYYKLGKLKLCRTTLKSIIADASFYKEKAKILLKQCEK
jgi:hypothetical protein